MEQLGAVDLRAAVVTYRDLLRAHQDRLNRLNVYPVPDGDTGTNMALTLESVVAELAEAESMPEVCTALRHGSLMGARGNSGVILSQVLRGIADGCKEHDAVGSADLARALHEASTAAYAAVMRPVEGTILTVVRASAEAAAEDGKGTICELLDAARVAAAEALDHTPELLPPLKQAGVVDAGGAGYLLLLDALLHVVDRRPLPEAPPVPAGVGVGADTRAAATQAGGAGEGHASEGHGGVGDLRYEVMYFLEGPDEAIPSFKEVWAGIGDSIVVVGGEGVWNCHIHTDDVGAAVEAALDVGRPRNIRVTDLQDQVEEERWVREAEAATDSTAPVPTAVVAVATGAGLQRIFRSLGVHGIVAGGQSMNPSTAQILEAVEAAPAGEVVVLPNNKNIIPVAEQVDGLTAKTVRVVRTTGVAEGFAALMEYDPEGTAEANAHCMTEAASRITSGEVTRAVRDSTTDIGSVTEGEFIGLTGNRIVVKHAALGDAVCELLDRIVSDDHELVTVMEGEGATPAVTRRITEWLREHRSTVAVEVHHGGQPLYPYLVAAE